MVATPVLTDGGRASPEPPPQATKASAVATASKPRHVMVAPCRHQIFVLIPINHPALSCNAGMLKKWPLRQRYGLAPAKSEANCNSFNSYQRFKFKG
jgi:hypothetical protein